MTLACDAPGRLVTQTRALLQRDPRTLPEIYKASGVPFYWLKKFRAGEVPNPSVNRIEYLYEFLTQSKLV